MPSMDTFTLITTDCLFWLNRRAKDARYGRTLSQAFSHKVKPTGLHTVIHNHLVDVDVVRCVVLVSIDGAQVPVHATLDVSYPDFFTLPRFTHDECGKVILCPRKKLTRRQRHQWATIADWVNTSEDK